MKTLMKFVVSIAILVLGCGRTSEAVDSTATATLSIFHTNDLMGYVRPCG